MLLHLGPFITFRPSPIALRVGKVKWTGQNVPVFPIIETHLHIINYSSRMIFTIQKEREQEA